MAEQSLQDTLAGAPLVGAGDMTLVGGAVREGGVEALVEWLRSLGEGPWWSFHECTDQMRLHDGLVLPDDGLVRVVWGRWFGPAGDLEARREGGRFRWRWVGDAGVRPTLEEVPVEADYFAGAAPVLRCAPEAQALLWDGRDARIATADADTRKPLPVDGGRSRLWYTPYYDRGVVAAVRYRRIEPVHATPKKEAR